MVNRAPEQELIDGFISHLYEHEDAEIRIEKLINKKCRSRTFSDVEFVSVLGVHWVIEAKTNNSSDKYNTVHKIFGELLKETGRDNRSHCRHAILIPGSEVEFYSRAMRKINRIKFIGFGELIPVEAVFTSDPERVERLSWVSLYDACKSSANAAHEVSR